MTYNIQIMEKTFKQQIPICFATDDNYVPFLTVALASLLDNASKENFYKIYVLTSKLSQKNMDSILKQKTENSSIEFIQLSKELDKVENLFHLRDYYSKETYYRIFIANLFPQYEKVLYLDCDITVLGDVSKLYNYIANGGGIPQFKLSGKAGLAYSFLEHDQKSYGYESKSDSNADGSYNWTIDQL